MDEIYFPKGLILAVVRRDTENIVPHGNTVLVDGDKLIVGAEGYKDEIGIKLRELVLRERHPWVGTAISRQRGDKFIIEKQENNV